MINSLQFTVAKSRVGLRKCEISINELFTDWQSCSKVSKWKLWLCKDLKFSKTLPMQLRRIPVTPCVSLLCLYQFISLSHSLCSCSTIWPNKKKVVLILKRIILAEYYLGLKLKCNPLYLLYIRFPIWIQLGGCIDE